MPVHSTTLEATADCEVRVARGATGGLRAGVEALFADADAVRECEVRAVGDVRPDAFDLYVDVTVALVVDIPADADAGADAETGPERVRHALRDAFGVREVGGVRVA